MDHSNKTDLTNRFPALCEIFIHNMQRKDDNVHDYEYKTNIVKFFTLFVQKSPEHIQPFIDSILPVIWQLVVEYSDLYTKTVIFKGRTCWETENEEGVLIGFTPLVLSIFDFIHSIVYCPNLSQFLNNVLSDIIYYIMIFMLISRQMENDWANDLNRYIEENFIDSYNVSIRVSARDLLMVIFLVNIYVQRPCSQLGIKVLVYIPELFSEICMI